MNNLHTKAWVALLLLFLVMAALLFIPPWTLDYWQAWMFLAVYFAASAAITLYLMKQDPQLLARRMSGGPRPRSCRRKGSSCRLRRWDLSACSSFRRWIDASGGRTCRPVLRSPETSWSGSASSAFSSSSGKIASPPRPSNWRRTKSHFDRALRAGAAPDVCRSPRHASRHTDCARLDVGRACFRCDHAGADLEIAGRRKISRQKPAGVSGVPNQGAISPDTASVVRGERFSATSAVLQSHVRTILPSTVPVASSSMARLGPLAEMWLR